MLSGLARLICSPCFCKKEQILAEVGLKPPAQPDVSDDERLAESLDCRPLGQ